MEHQFGAMNLNGAGGPRPANAGRPNGPGWNGAGQQGSLLKGFTLRRAPAPSGEQPRWSAVSKTPWSIPESELEKNVAGQKRTKVSKCYQALSANQQRQVDRLVEAEMMQERHPSYEWRYAYIKADKKAVRGSGSAFGFELVPRPVETAVIYVILQRELRGQSGSATSRMLSTEVGEIVDLNLPRSRAQPNLPASLGRVPAPGPHGALPAHQGAGSHPSANHHLGQGNRGGPVVSGGAGHGGHGGPPPPPLHHGNMAGSGQARPPPPPMPMPPVNLGKAKKNKVKVQHGHGWSDDSVISDSDSSSDRYSDSETNPSSYASTPSSPRASLRHGSSYIKIKPAGSKRSSSRGPSYREHHKYHPEHDHRPSRGVDYERATMHRADRHDAPVMMVHRRNSLSGGERVPFARSNGFDPRGPHPPVSRQFGPPPARPVYTTVPVMDASALAYEEDLMAEQILRERAQEALQRRRASVLYGPADYMPVFR